MRVEYTLTQKDYIDFQLWAMDNLPEYSKMLRKFRLLIPALLVFLLVIVFLLEPSWSARLLFTILVLVGSVLGYFIFPVRIRRGAKKQLEKMVRSGKMHFGPGVLTLTQDEAVDESPSRTVTVPLAEIRTVLDVKQGIYMPYSGVEVLLLPQTAFESEAHKQELLQQLRDAVAHAREEAAS